MTRRLVRAVVVGDKGVGKSSMIIASCSNIIREDTPSVLPETTLSHIAAEYEINFTCIDTSSDPILISETRNAVAAANVVLVCFSCSVMSSLENAVTIWIKNVTSWSPGAIVYLVECKEDVQKASEEQRSVRYAPVDTCAKTTSLGLAMFSQGSRVVRACMHTKQSVTHMGVHSCFQNDHFTPPSFF